MLLRQEQRQTISQRIDPKLIMANAILQQSTIELVQNIEAELLENPALEVMEEQPACTGDCIDPLSCPYCAARLQAQAKREADGQAPEFEPEYFPEATFDPDDDFDPVSNIEAEVTLQDHLRALLRAAVSDEDYPVGEYLINNLDDNGWLDGNLEELALEMGVDLERAETALKVIQTFDPPGVGARDLQECLLIQLHFLREEGQGNALAERILRTNFQDVVSRRYSRIARALGQSVDKAKQTVEFIRGHLNPYPANQFRPPWAYKPTNNRSSVKPDVVIRRTEFGYEVDVTGAEAFALGVNPTYREVYNNLKVGAARATDDERKHITEYVERAELFIRNINQRRRTLRHITKCIIDLQQGYLETGSRAYLRPLTRTKVAEILGMHESTISRATARKFVQLPNQEVVPFELFFNPSIAIKTAIEDIIANEDPAHPLSDRQIVDRLKERGIDVARRTVVKYRDSQKLLASNRRRR